MKTIAAVADDLLGSGNAGGSIQAAAPTVPGQRVGRLKDVSVIAAVVLTETAWVAFLAYELWFRLL